MADDAKAERPAKRPRLDDGGDSWKPGSGAFGGGRGRGRGGYAGRGGGRGGGGRFGGSSTGVAYGPPKTATKQPHVNPADVGISLFLGGGEGEHRVPFTGELKARYTDFIVQEIDVSGSVVRLTDTSPSVPDDIVERVKRMPYEERAKEYLDLVRPLMKPEDGDAVAAFLLPPATGLEGTLGEAASAAPSSPTGERELVVPAPASRDDRTKVFEAARLYLAKEILCDTAKGGHATTMAADAPSDGAASASSASAPVPGRQAATTLISFVKKGVKDSGNNNNNNNNSSSQQQQPQWPSVRPDFLQFVLHKQNVDTPSAIASICRATGIKEKAFGYAGTKDRRAVTTQLVTAYRVPPQRLAGLNVSGGARGIVTGNFRFVPAPLKLGHLTGNRFTLVIREVKLLPAAADAGTSRSSADVDVDVAATEAAIDRSLTAWREATGCRFPNYFGLQRFGNASGPTHVKGRLMLQHDHQGLIDSFFNGGQEGGDVAHGGASSGAAGKESADYRAYWRATKDASGTLDRLLSSGTASSCHVETAVLQEVIGRGGYASSGACACAIKAIPPRIRNLYIHAYQSRLWNCMATARLAKQGLQVVAGDVVIVDSSSSSSAAAASSSSSSWSSSSAEADDGGAAAAAETADGGEAEGPKADEAEGIEDQQQKLHLVTAEDIAAARYSIDDVALPMVGMTTHLFPAIEGLNAAAVVKMLRDDGLPIPKEKEDEDDHTAGEAMRRFFNHKDSTYRVMGTYRKVVARAKDLEWSFRRYNNSMATAGENDFSLDFSTTDLDALEPSVRAKIRSIPMQQPQSTSSATSSSASSGTKVQEEKEEVASAASAASEPTAAPPAPAGPAATEPQQLALRIGFSLPKSSYATIAMREVMRNEEAAARAE